MRRSAPDWASRAEGAIGTVIDGAGAATAWVGLALVLVVAANVLLRYLLNTGSVALQELEWHLMVPIALFGMAYGMHKGSHVRVDFLYDRLPERARSVIDLIAALMMIGLAVVIVVLSIPYVGQSLQLAEGSPDPGGLPYRWALKALIPAGFACFGLQAVAQALQAALRLAPSTIRENALSGPRRQPSEVAALS
jgi:TRAP-type mannitol/chloroaromatic compound transport system permease small subunit